MPIVELAAQISGLLAADEESYNAVQVIAAPVLSGTIVDCYVEDSIGTGYWSPSFPVDIPYGHLIRVHFTFVNTGTVAAQFYHTIELIDPDGIVRASAIGNIQVQPEWQVASARTSYVTLNKANIWVVHCLLEVMS